MNPQASHALSQVTRGVLIFFASCQCDECSEVYGVKMNDCHPKASCVNTQGSYNCSCNPSYIGNGSIREDKCQCTSC